MCIRDRLADVDVVVDPGEDVVVVVRDRAVADVRGDDRGAHGERLEELRRVLQVRLHLGAGQHDRFQGVVVDVEPRDVLDLDVALREHRGPAERGGDREDREARVRGAGQRRGHLVGLHLVDVVQDRGVLVPRGRGGELLGGGGHDLVHVRHGLVVLALGDGQHLRVGLDRVGVQRRRRRGRDLPAAVLTDQIEVHLGDPLAPLRRLRGQDLLAGRGVGDELLRDLQVGVPEEDRVDAGHLLGDQADRVLVRQLGTVAGGAAVTAVRDHDHDVRAAAPNLRHPLGGGLDHAEEVQLALDVALVPDRDTRVGQAQDADAQGRRVLAERDLLDDVRREGRLAVLGAHRVGRQGREAELPDPQVQQRQAVVELVVAEHDRVVAQHVHRLGHRVLLTGGGDRLLLGVVRGQRRALDRVAGVEHQRAAGRLGAQLVDQRGGLGDADVVVRGVVVLGVLVVVPVVDVAVQVRSAQDGQVEGLRRLRRLRVTVALAAGLRRARESEGRRGGGSRDRQHATPRYAVGKRHCEPFAKIDERASWAPQPKHPNGR